MNQTPLDLFEDVDTDPDPEDPAVPVCERCGLPEPEWLGPKLFDGKFCSDCWCRREREDA